MPKIALLLLFIGGVAVNGQATEMRRRCGVNEVFYPGGRPRPDQFCKPRLTHRALLFKLRWCLCKPGYVRNAWEQCIKQHECSQCRRDANTDFNPCSSACPEICGKPRPLVCTLQCVIGCACPPGFVRAFPKGPCISQRMCQGRCPGRHQFFTACKSACPATCKNPYPRCPRICAGNGCVCQPGYVMLKKEPLTCVRLDQCPGFQKRCPGPNQVYTTCRPRCPATCSASGNSVCTADCAGRGCVCRPGYVQLNAMPLICVRPSQCPPKPKPKCPGPNQVFSTCVSRCHRTCRNPTERFCPAVCAGQGCVCKPGYIMKDTLPLTCVRPEQCPPKLAGAAPLPVRLPITSISK
ncbi:zonadhesin-like [Amblyomma americanum]